MCHVTQQNTQYCVILQNLVSPRKPTMASLSQEELF